MTKSFKPIFRITNRITAGLTRIDRARPAFYLAIQGVRESHMDMTGWLEYFVEGLTTQLTEIRERRELSIRRDLLIKEHGLSNRQANALGHILEHGSLPIQ